MHAVASAVGAFFRELPEPLLTWDMYVEFIRAMGELGLAMRGRAGYEGAGLFVGIWAMGAGIWVSGRMSTLSRGCR